MSVYEMEERQSERGRELVNSPDTGAGMGLGEPGIRNAVWVVHRDHKETTAEISHCCVLVCIVSRLK